MAVDKATAWQLSGPEPAQDVAIVATGLDGTTMPLVGEAYQEARCGTVALDDQEGERLTTAYLGALPEAFLWLDQCLQNREPGKMLVDKETVFCLENILRRAIYGTPAQLREIDQLREQVSGLSISPGRLTRLLPPHQHQRKDLSCCSARWDQS